MVINYPLHFQLNTYEPRKALWFAISQHVKNRKPEWLPCYEQVARWLADNDSRGLICLGSCGVGKSVICMQALPYIFKHCFGGIDLLSVTATEMNLRIDELLAYCGHNREHNRIIVIDDLGTEPVETVNYGNRRKPFPELVDAAERTGTLLIITTNLRTNRDSDTHRNYPSIETRYGVPTLDRLRAITRVAVFTGDTMRK
jgi:DNA replication protein DnaC